MLPVQKTQIQDSSVSPGASVNSSGHLLLSTTSKTREGESDSVCSYREARKENSQIPVFCYRYIAL